MDLPFFFAFICMHDSFVNKKTTKDTQEQKIEQKFKSKQDEERENNDYK